jgi:hypothetical protein
LDSVREVLADMKRGKAPAMTMLQSTAFFRKVACALPEFCVHAGKQGGEALKLKFKDSRTHTLASNLHKCLLLFRSSLSVSIVLAFAF